MPELLLEYLHLVKFVELKLVDLIAVLVHCGDNMLEELLETVGFEIETDEVSSEVTLGLKNFILVIRILPGEEAMEYN